MSHQHFDSYTVHMKGGKGGSGGLGSGQGQGGWEGDGLGPTLEIGTATVHIQGGAEIDIWDQDIVISWLSPINFFPWQQEISQMRQPGTGEWLLENPHFKKNGNLVQGKLSFQTPPKLLAALWRQLVLDRDISSDQKELYKQHYKRGTSLPLQEVAGILTSSLKKFSQVFIVIDAIDEYPEEQHFILLKHLTEQMGLSLSPTLPNDETLEIGAMPCYHACSSMSRGNPAYEKTFIQKLAVNPWMEFLNALPKSLYGTYEIAIQRIEAQSKEDRKITHSTITWVANAKQPLTTEELQVALAVEPGMQQLNEENLMNIDIILSVCTGLVIVNKESSVVPLIHFTTQEYLDSIQTVLFPDAQREITEILLAFLTFNGYPDSLWESGNLSPLVEYSCSIAFHMLLDDLKFHTEKFLAAANFVETTKFLLEEPPLLQHSKNPEIIVASFYGHTKIVGILLEKGANGANVNAAGGRFGSPLQAAAGDHTEIVSILLEKGANINAGGGRYESQVFAVEPPSATRWLIRHAVLGGYIGWWLLGWLLIIEAVLKFRLHFAGLLRAIT
ncbi:hypothetical protein DFH08DRAFT_817316 [Mycena albidolilacea]|uniref:Uncharacterized protein n=1 Tax=Mycena albidolilacea TaxID=1033008 RepID=A0AAD6ZIK0_9AGAR|nr:hypothetical protein DFH08DRAFT_817316 [Mycena albidolilacea]